MFHYYLERELWIRVKCHRDRDLLFPIQDFTFSSAFGYSLTAAVNEYHSGVFRAPPASVAQVDLIATAPSVFPAANRQARPGRDDHSDCANHQRRDRDYQVPGF